MYTFLYGEGEFSARGFPRGIFHGEGSFQGVNLLGEIIYWGIFPDILNKILFICLAFSFPTKFYK